MGRAQHGMFELARHGMAGEQHGHGMVCVNQPLHVRTTAAAAGRWFEMGN